MESLTCNLNAGIRRETLNGRAYIVAPLTMIVEGVLPGSKGSLYYPPEEIARDPSIWNGMPITNGHPYSSDGKRISARSPKVLQEQQIGTVFNTSFSGKLVAEGWFDVEKTSQIAPEVITNLLRRKPMELSTGLFVTMTPVENGDFNGIPFSHVASNFRADHLAVLLNQSGACSLSDGCGVLVNEEHPLENYNPSQPRDGQGRWSGGGSGGGSSGGSEKPIEVTSYSQAGSSESTAKFQEHADYVSGQADKISSGLKSRMSEVTAEEHRGAVRAQMEASRKQSQAGQAQAAARHEAIAKQHEEFAKQSTETISADVKARLGKGDTSGWGRSKMSVLNPNVEQVKHSIRLPSDKTKLTIQKTEKALAEMGFSLGMGSHDLKSKQTSYVVTKKGGRSSVMSASDITKLVYDGAVHNRKGDSNMPLTKEKREEKINRLVHNCKCSEEDREIFNEMSDESLTSLDSLHEDNTNLALVANAAVTGVKTPVGQYSYNPAEKKWDLTPVSSVENKKETKMEQPKTAVEWLDTAPSEIREVVENAMEIQHKEKESLVRQLIVNVADDKKQEIGEKFMKKPMGELRELVSLLPVENAATLRRAVNIATPNFTESPKVQSRDELTENERSDVLEMPSLDLQSPVIANWYERRSGKTA